jgi:hypothetical protein
MVFIFPLAIWLGIITFALLATTLSLGVAFHYFHKDVFRYHKFFAFLTISVAAVHAIFATLLWFFGVII